MEVQHELPDGDLEDFKQTHVLKECVRHLLRHNNSQHFKTVFSQPGPSLKPACKSNPKKRAGRTTLAATDMAENPPGPSSSDVHQVKNLEVPRVHLLHVAFMILQHGI